MVGGADGAVLAVKVKLSPAVGLAKDLSSAHVAGSSHVELGHAFRIDARNIPLVDGIDQCGGMNRGFGSVDQSCPVELSEEWT